MKIQMTFAVALMCSAALSAQSTMDKDKGEMGQDKMMKDGMMTVTGCVAQGADATHFKLTNAMASTMPMGKMDSGAMKSDDTKAGGMKSEGMAYALDGGNNLKAHLGHKVEVSGTMDKDAMMDHDKKMGTSGAAMGKDAPAATGKDTTATMDKDKMGTMDHSKMGSMDKDMMAGKIKVKSVKMISANCP